MLALAVPIWEAAGQAPACHASCEQSDRLAVLSAIEYPQLRMNAIASLWDNDDDVTTAVANRVLGTEGFRP